MKNKNGFVTCYHITYEDVIKSIQKDGLIPQTGDRSAQLEEPADRVYLFPDKESTENALSNWDIWDEDRFLALIELSVPETLLEQGETPYEVYANKTISPDYIKRIIKEKEMNDFFQESAKKTTDEHDDR